MPAKKKKRTAKKRTTKKRTAKKRTAKKRTAKKRTAKKRTTKNTANPVSGARQRYIETHWGDAGPVPEYSARVADPWAQTPVDLGELVEVVYRTKKGRSKRGDYSHRFPRGKAPRLAFNDGGLIVVGGSYRVNERGIVG